MFVIAHSFSPPLDNSDLYFKINPDGLGGCNLTDHGFAYMWASARATWGVKGGKYYYEVRVEENLEVDLPDTEEHPHAIRYVMCMVMDDIWYRVVRSICCT